MRHKNSASGNQRRRERFFFLLGYLLHESAPYVLWFKPPPCLDKDNQLYGFKDRNSSLMLPYEITIEILDCLDANLS